MPVQKLSRDDKLDLENFYYYAHDTYPDDFEIKEWVKDLNHIFAKIYGYKRTARPKSRRSGTRAPPKKKKVSAYAKRYGTAFKKLKRKHPRMSFGSLSSKAHKQARRKK